MARGVVTVVAVVRWRSAVRGSSVAVAVAVAVARDVVFFHRNKAMVAMVADRLSVVARATQGAGFVARDLPAEEVCLGR